MKAPLLNFKNEAVGEIEIPETVFGVSWKPALVRQIITAHLANKRKPWAHTKDRSDVRGGGRKPWRQKGTGRARQGSTRSPLWVGGGKSHGPTNERDYSQKVNKKMGRVALFSILSKKLKEGNIKFVETLELEAPKTKLLAAPLGTLFALQKKKTANALLIPGSENKNIFRAAANLPKTLAMSPESLNAYEVLNHGNIVIDQKAVPVIAAHYKIK
jgi:large subunit ribosomal protein L4